MALPNFPQFKEIGPEDIPIIKKYIERVKATVCELNPSNLLIWRHMDQPKLTLIFDNLCILITPKSEAPFFLEPLGQNRILETLEVCIKHSGQLARVSQSFIEKHLPYIFDGPVALSADSHIRICPYSEDAHDDYIYLTETLATLSGRKFDGKRNHIRQFYKRFPSAQFLPLQSHMANQVIQVFKIWSDQKTNLNPPAQAQIEAISTLFNHFSSLNVHGGLMTVDSKPKGVIIGTKTRPDMINVHIQYGLPNTPGIYQALLQAFCVNAARQFPLINLEQDLGLEGLKKMKRSYYPHHIEKKYILRPC